MLIALSGIFGSAIFYTFISKFSHAVVSPGPEVEQLIAQAKSMTVTIAVLTVILGSLITFVLLKQIVTPIQAMILALAEHEKTGKAMRINIPNRDEVGILAFYINKIIEKKK